MVTPSSLKASRQNSSTATNPTRAPPPPSRRAVPPRRVPGRPVEPEPEPEPELEEEQHHEEEEEVEEEEEALEGEWAEVLYDYTSSVRVCFLLHHGKKILSDCRSIVPLLLGLCSQNKQLHFSFLPIFRFLTDE